MALENSAAVWVFADIFLVRMLAVFLFSLFLFKMRSKLTFPSELCRKAETEEESRA